MRKAMWSCTRTFPIQNEHFNRSAYRLYNSSTSLTGDTTFDIHWDKSLSFCRINLDSDTNHMENKLAYLHSCRNITLHRSLQSSEAILKEYSRHIKFSPKDVDQSLCFKTSLYMSLFMLSHCLHKRTIPVVWIFFCKRHHIISKHE